MVAAGQVERRFDVDAEVEVEPAAVGVEVGGERSRSVTRARGRVEVEVEAIWVLDREQYWDSWIILICLFFCFFLRTGVDVMMGLVDLDCVVFNG